MQDKRRFIPFCAGNAERWVPLWSSEIQSSRASCYTLLVQEPLPNKADAVVQLD